MISSSHAFYVSTTGTGPDPVAVTIPPWGTIVRIRAVSPANVTILPRVTRDEPATPPPYSEGEIAATPGAAAEELDQTTSAPYFSNAAGEALIVPGGTVGIGDAWRVDLWIRPGRY